MLRKPNARMLFVARRLSRSYVVLGTAHTD